MGKLTEPSLTINQTSKSLIMTKEYLLLDTEISGDRNVIKKTKKILKNKDLTI
jgi:hypothetical protein